jgi:hypothetical protein
MVVIILAFVVLLILAIVGDRKYIWWELTHGLGQFLLFILACIIAIIFVAVLTIGAITHV